MGQLGMKVMINYLGGNEETVNVIKNSLGKSVKDVYMKDDVLHFEFYDNTKMIMFDDGQSCCETRYMMTSDDLSYYKDSRFLNVELREVPNRDADYGEHEVQFLLITTDKGVFTMETHNEHNGYYGGFSIVARSE